MSRIDRYKEMKNTQLYLNELFGVDVNEFVYHTSPSNNIIVNIRYLNQLGGMIEVQENNSDILNCISKALNDLSSDIRNRAIEIFEQKIQKQKEEARQEAETFLQEKT